MSVRVTGLPFHERRWWLPAQLLVLAIAALGPYLPALTYEWAYDDLGQLVENPFLRNPARVRDVLLGQTLARDYVVNGRRPLVLLSYFTDRALWGLNPAGYRATNLAYHLGVTWALFFLARRLARGVLPHPARADALAILAAALFAAHPLLTEAVHAPAFRPDVMCALFMLAYLLCGTRGAAGSGARHGLRLAGQAALLWLALCAKESAAVAPAFLVAAWWFFPRARPGVARGAAALGVGGAVILAFAALGAQSGSIQALTSSWNGLALLPPVNWWTAPWLWLRYAGLLLAPWPLNIERLVTPVTGMGDWRFWAGVTAMAAAVALAAGGRRRWPLAGFGLGWILLAFLPVANLVPLFNPMAERYAYVMVSGFTLAVAAVILGPAWTGRAWKWIRNAAIMGLFLGYAVLTTARLEDWRTNTGLWRAALDHEPRSARAHVWIGLDLKRQGRLDEALQRYRLAEELNPWDVSALINRAILFGQLGEIAVAERCLRTAIARRPDKADAHWNLVVALQLQGRDREALDELDRTLILDPMHVAALRARIAELAGAGHYAAALRDAQRLLDIDPQDPDAVQASRNLHRLMAGPRPATAQP